LTDLDEGYRRAEAITRARAKSFAFAAAVLDPKTRRAAFALYAFCRRCDDAVDGSERGVLGLRAEILAAYAGDDLGDPILAAFGDTARAYGVPREAVLGLIDAMERDLAPVRLASWEELDAYAELAAGTVGRMMAAVLGVARAEAALHAAALGRAMQLTNCARDVREDFVVHGRIYVPIARYGVTARDLERWSAARALDASPAADGFRALMRDLERNARALYDFADAGVPYIVTRRGRACVRLMAGAYAAILDALAARGHDPFAGRARAKTGEKLRRAVLG
jgi:phytoene synthase